MGDALVYVRVKTGQRLSVRVILGQSRSVRRNPDTNTTTVMTAETPSITPPRDSILLDSILCAQNSLTHTALSYATLPPPSSTRLSRKLLRRTDRASSARALASSACSGCWRAK